MDSIIIPCRIPLWCIRWFKWCVYVVSFCCLVVTIVIYVQGLWNALLMGSFSSTTLFAWACTNVHIPSGQNTGSRFLILDHAVAGSASCIVSCRNNDSHGCLWEWSSGSDCRFIFLISGKLQAVESPWIHCTFPFVFAKPLIYYCIFFFKWQWKAHFCPYIGAR